MALKPTDRYGVVSCFPASVRDEIGVSGIQERQNGDEEVSIHVRCDEAALRALLAAPRSPKVILCEYARDHQAFYNAWERRFEQFWEEHGEAVQDSKEINDLVAEYKKARMEFSGRWLHGVNRVVLIARDELTRSRTKKILHDAGMREQLFNKWLGRTIS